jgi:hypothetical protein
MVNEHPHWQQIWDTHVIDKTCHIAIVSCINAVRLSILNTKNKINLYQYIYTQILSFKTITVESCTQGVHIFSNPVFVILPISLDFMNV